MGDKNPNKAMKKKKTIEKVVEPPAIAAMNTPVRKPKK